MTNAQINEQVVMILGTNRTEHKYVVKSFYSPNYAGSLDACREFEQTLNQDERNAYAFRLNAACGNACFATPLERCEAFLRMKGQWK